MKETFVKQRMKVTLENSILIEGLPGLGMVGRIATRYLIKHLNAKKFAELYSPHFPYYVLVNKKGSVRLLRGNFYVWRNNTGENDLIFLTGDSQAQTIEGQYEVSSCILNFVSKLNTKLIITVGGYRKEVEEKPNVVAVSTNPKILKRALQAKALLGSSGNPIVGTAGLLLGLAKFQNIDALCLLGETRGYLSDPLAAQSVLEVLQRMLGIKVDMSDLDQEIEKSKQIVARMQEIEQRREEYARKMRKTEEGRITYIS